MKAGQSRKMHQLNRHPLAKAAIRQLEEAERVQEWRSDFGIIVMIE